jgi:RecB family endonuclease NucS
VLLSWLQDPSAGDLVAFLTAELQQPGRWLQVAGEMEVEYHGRAASMADAGDYLLILKPDASLQIHAARGIKPLNWQPQVDEVHVTNDDGRAVLHAERWTPAEWVRVVFLDAVYAVAMEPRDHGTRVLQGSEADMQRALAANPSVIEDGLEVVEVELPVDVGGIDLMGRDREGRFVVVELKRGRATHEAVHQLERYVRHVQTLVDGPVRGILASPGVTDPARTQLLGLGLEHVEIEALPAPPAAVEQAGLFETPVDASDVES